MRFFNFRHFGLIIFGFKLIFDCVADVVCTFRNTFFTNVTKAFPLLAESCKSLVREMCWSFEV